MKLQTLSKLHYTVTAVIDERKGESCPLIDCLEKLSNQYTASVSGIVELFDMVAKDGLTALSSKQCHYVDKNEKIYEFIKGDIRVFFFKGHQNVIVIATHAIIKKTQKTTKKDKDIAIKLKKKYQQAHDNGSLKIINSEE